MLVDFRAVQSQSHQIYRVVFLLVAFLFIGTIGYHFIERFDWIDSIYMTSVILSTVGFGGGMEELSQIGRLFTIILILVGVSFVLYLFGKITETVVEGGLVM